jgi:hypothetical protein
MLEVSKNGSWCPVKSWLGLATLSMTWNTAILGFVMMPFAGGRLQGSDFGESKVSPVAVRASMPVPSVCTNRFPGALLFQAPRCFCDNRSPKNGNRYRSFNFILQQKLLSSDTVSGGFNCQAGVSSSRLFRLTTVNAPEPPPSLDN